MLRATTMHDSDDGCKQKTASCHQGSDRRQLAKPFHMSLQKRLSRKWVGASMHLANRVCSVALWLEVLWHDFFRQVETVLLIVWDDACLQAKPAREHIVRLGGEG